MAVLLLPTPRLGWRVMPGFMPGIHDLLFASKQDVDGRDKPGHDELLSPRPAAKAQCFCAADDFWNAAFCSGEASFWCFAFHCSNGSP